MLNKTFSVILKQSLQIETFSTFLFGYYSKPANFTVFINKSRKKILWFASLASGFWLTLKLFEVRTFVFDAFELSFKVILAENEVRSLTILLFLQFVNAFFGKAKKQSPDLNQSLVGWGGLLCSESERRANEAREKLFNKSSLESSKCVRRSSTCFDQ